MGKKAFPQCLVEIKDSDIKDFQLSFGKKGEFVYKDYCRQIYSF